MLGFVKYFLISIFLTPPLKKIKLEILGLSSSQSQSGSFALVLGETEGNRRLPIIIGMFEAQAIAIEIEKIIPNRPMTHDLVADMGGSFSAEHGIGQLKVGELERYAQPTELAAMRTIKRALDPNGILNPGKVLRGSAL